MQKQKSQYHWDKVPANPDLLIFVYVVFLLEYLSSSLFCGRGAKNMLNWTMVTGLQPVERYWLTILTWVLLIAPYNFLLVRFHFAFQSEHSVYPWFWFFIVHNSSCHIFPSISYADKDREWIKSESKEDWDIQQVETKITQQDLSQRDEQWRGCWGIHWLCRWVILHYIMKSNSTCQKVSD